MITIILSIQSTFLNTFYYLALTIRTRLYIFLDDPKGYMAKLSTKCAKQMYEYIDSHDIPESNEEK